MTSLEPEASAGAPAPTERLLARLQVHAVPQGGRVTGAVVEAAAAELGLTDEQAAHLSQAAAAVSRAIHRRGFDDPADATIDVEVVRVGHRVVVRLDDLGLPFDYEDTDELDGAVLQQALDEGWVDEIHHTWRGRDGNRTTLVRHLDPGAEVADPPPTIDPDDVRALANQDVETRLGSAEDADAICRLTWRTYGATYQHDEYYRPEQLASMLADGTQISFLSTIASGEVVAHSALLIDEPGAVVVEAGRAMVDPRFRGHRLLGFERALRQQWFTEHGVLAMVGEAVTAHTRSQAEGPVMSMLLGFLPPITFAGIGGTDTPLREAVVGGIFPMATIPAQTVHAPQRDAEMVMQLYGLQQLERTLAPRPSGPASGASVVEVSVRADLGHAVISIARIGADLDDQLEQRLGSIRAGGIEVAYIDISLDDPAASWAADVAVAHGSIFAGVLPLRRGGVDVVRYQHLGTTVVDPAAIHLRSPAARELLDYVLAQRGGTP